MRINLIYSNITLVLRVLFLSKKIAFGNLGQNSCDIPEIFCIDHDFKMFFFSFSPNLLSPSTKMKAEVEPNKFL